MLWVWVSHEYASAATNARLVPPRNERLIERLLQKTLAEGGAQPPRTGRPLTNQDVLDLLKAEMSPKLIIAKVERSHGSTFDTSPEAMKKLKCAGVPESLILVMIQAEQRRLYVVQTTKRPCSQSARLVDDRPSSVFN
jgi:hypothetical protein